MADVSQPWVCQASFGLTLGSVTVTCAAAHHDSQVSLLDRSLSKLY